MLVVSWHYREGVSTGCQLAITRTLQFWRSAGHYRETSVLAVSWPLQGGVSADCKLAITGMLQCWRLAVHYRVLSVCWALTLKDMVNAGKG